VTDAASSRVVRVLVADDHAATRFGIRSALEGEGFLVCAEAADGPSAVEAAIETRPEACLMDINMPGGGIDATAEITSRLPETKVVMLTASEDDQDLFASIRAGASGYLLKGIAEEDLARRLDEVLSGEGVLSQGLVGRLIEEFRRRDRPQRLRLKKKPVSELTEREWDVLSLLHEGLSTADIADRLSLAPVSVRSYISDILKKLRVQSRKEATELVEKDS
jgi:DNA-binding NarL/FixJ family response regulator